MKFGETKINPAWIAAGAVMVAAAKGIPLGPGPGPGSWAPKWHVNQSVYSHNAINMRWLISSIDYPAEQYLAYFYFGSFAPELLRIDAANLESSDIYSYE